jgi:hypothetical protein
VKEDGKRCAAHAQVGRKYCFFHDPDTREAQREAGRAGGSRPKLKTLGADAPDVAVADVGGVVTLLAETISQVRRGELDPRIGNALGYLSGILLRALELTKADLPPEVPGLGPAAGGIGETLRQFREHQKSMSELHQFLEESVGDGMDSSK